MKVRISYVVDVPDAFRRAINQRFGKEGLATREEIKTHYEQNGSSIDDDVMSEYVPDMTDGTPQHSDVEE